MILKKPNELDVTDEYKNPLPVYYYKESACARGGGESGEWAGIGEFRNIWGDLMFCRI